MLKVFFGVWAVVLSLGSVSASGAELLLNKDGKPLIGVGDPAPPLEVGKWIQGGPYDHFEKGKVYLVEFWATWCAVCKQTIPHIDEIHKKYGPKGLTVMAISIAEEDQKLVPRFVKQMGDKMTYPVAIDKVTGESGKMDSAWMDASGNTELPKAFLINKDGLIAFLGSATIVDDALIESVLNDKIDIKAARADYFMARENKVKIARLQDQVERAAGAKDWAKAEQLMDEIEKLTVKDDLDSLALDRISLALKAKNSAKVEKMAADLAARSQDKLRVLDSLAWVISLDADPASGAMAIADKAIKRASELGKGKDASVFETMARVQFIKGDKTGAILTQQKGLEVAAEEKKPHFEKVLKAYKEGHLPEE